MIQSVTINGSCEKLVSGVCVDGWSDGSLGTAGE